VAAKRRRDIKKDKFAQGLASLTVKARRYLPYIVSAVFAILILILALAWLGQASARRDAFAWDNIIAGTVPEELLSTAADSHSSKAAAWALARAAQLLFDQARYQEVISTSQNLIENHPSSSAVPIARLLMAKAYKELDQIEDAIAVFRSPDLASSYLAAEAEWSAALSLETVGRLEEAEAAYTQLASDSPDLVWGELASLRLARLGGDLQPIAIATDSAAAPAQPITPATDSIAVAHPIQTILAATDSNAPTAPVPEAQ